MAMGSYFLGSEVKIPMIVQVNGISQPGITPVIEKIILPSGANETGFPREMNIVSSGSSTYYYNYKPTKIGDYIVIINLQYEGDTYTTIENFTVNDNILKIATRHIPKAVAS
jgi:hypothetical protein